MPSTKRYCLYCSILLLWLITWIVISWSAVQDDAFIHFRYASNLFLRSFVTYDGVHPDYGASSLLYVGILALLRTMTVSPELPRAISSTVHILLFGGLALALGRLSERANAARLAGLVLLGILVAPSAVRWLDDGMETGLVVSVATVMAWSLHEGAVWSRWRSVLLGAGAFAAVLLRSELLLLCGVGALILLLNERHAPKRGPAIASAVGAAAAVTLIGATMHVLLPDTAVAKSHGIAHWFNTINDTSATLAGGLSFGAGLMVLWLATLGMVAIRGGWTLRTALANCFCPVVLVLSALRGQEMQGARYFAWTFVFSIVWNILELKEMVDGRVFWSIEDSRGIALLYVFAGLLAMELPMESVAMHRVLTRRSETMRVFESQHLEVLKGRRGVAGDVGYIGYFTGAEICDLAGLVNGRAAARLSGRERLAVCAGTNPEFMFLNAGQLSAMGSIDGISEWQVCGRYDFVNVRGPDNHYLLVRPEIAGEVCRATGREPVAVGTVFRVKPELIAQKTAEWEVR